MNVNIVTAHPRLVHAQMETDLAQSTAKNCHPGTDPVTGLPNRAMLEWYLEHLFALASESPLNSALLVISLKEAKTMRFAFGDTICNQFMRITGQHFREIATPGQFVAALSEDEFAFVISKSAGREECMAQARKLLMRLSEPTRIAGRVYFSSVHIGIALAEIESETAVDMLHRAQAVLHETRLDGSEDIRFADSDSARLAREELSMLNEVHAACERGEFYLHYQPIFNLRNQELRGLEALLRWKSPRFGEVPPARFIPLLEKYGGILDVGEWVLHNVCRQARDWNQSSANPLRISVNVSALQLENADFEIRLADILAETRCQPNWIELEITESVAVRVMDRVHNRLLSIAARGITLAIDDFGAGYSSFGHLARLPVHHLKLGRTLMSSLPHDRKGLAIVRAIQVLSNTLGLTLTAEGIERDDQRIFCQQAGIEQGQGFLLGMPETSSEIEAALDVARVSSAIAA